MCVVPSVLQVLHGTLAFCMCAWRCRWMPTFECPVLLVLARRRRSSFFEWRLPCALPAHSAALVSAQGTLCRAWPVQWLPLTTDQRWHILILQDPYAFCACDPGTVLVHQNNNHHSQFVAHQSEACGAQGQVQSLAVHFIHCHIRTVDWGWKSESQGKGG